MDIITLLKDKRVWEDFILYKAEGGHTPVKELKALSEYVHTLKYLETVEKIPQGFGHPRKRLISKASSEKKRVVYTFSTEENYLLKVMTYLLIRRYDPIFADNLFSFRAEHGIRKVVGYLKSDKNISARYVYKLDISDYFNSIDTALLLPELKEIMGDDPETYEFIRKLLTDPYVVLQDGTQVCEQKGIMAGVPLASFLANVFLCQLDHKFCKPGIRYARYSDDIIIFAESTDLREQAVQELHAILAERHLKINRKKEAYTEPFGKWAFLGISYQNGIFDISDISAKKLCNKIRRKARALVRWGHRKNLPREKAAKAFVKAMNRKLYEEEKRGELTWSRWFFPVINTTKTLSRIDHYIQDCIRFIITERHNKKRFNVRYEQMKQLGYRSLVHEYYKVMETTQQKSTTNSSSD